MHWRDQYLTGVRIDRSIVNTSSGSGLVNPLPGQTNYAAKRCVRNCIVNALELGRFVVLERAGNTARPRDHSSLIREWSSRSRRVPPIVWWLRSRPSTSNPARLTTRCDAVLNGSM